MIMLAVGEVEDSIFKKRKDDDVIFFIVVLTFLAFVFNHLLLARDTPLSE